MAVAGPVIAKDLAVSRSMSEIEIYRQLPTENLSFSSTLSPYSGLNFPDRPAYLETIRVMNEAAIRTCWLSFGTFCSLGYPS